MRNFCICVYTLALVFILCHRFNEVTGGGAHPAPSGFATYAVAIVAAVLIPWAFHIWRK